MSALAIALALVAPQSHDMRAMPGMAMPARPAATKPAARKRAAPKTAARPAIQPAARACPPEHAAMGHCKPPAAGAMPDMAPAPAPAPTMPGMAMPAAVADCPPEHAAMGHCTPVATPPAGAIGTDRAAGDAPPPAAPTTRAADAFYDPVAIAAADRAMRAEHGGMRFGQVMVNIAEAQAKRGRDGYRWDGEGWFGGDIHRVVVKSEGEGGFGDRVEAAEVQALYSKALDPYWNVQAGVRQDLGAGARRTYATVGVEGLAPYWFEVEGALFLSDKGDVLARVEAWYDQRITQRLILQPRVEIDVAAQDMPASRVGSGLSTAEIGLRLRYELRREIAPYVGLSWERRYGDTARYARAAGDGTGGVALALGMRAWF